MVDRCLKHFLALLQRQTVWSSGLDLPQGLLDSAANDGVANYAILGEGVSPAKSIQQLSSSWQMG
jgi:hypothetical protein